MAKLSELDQEEKYKCDSCKKVFPLSEIKFVEAADNITILTPPMPFVFLDKDGIITGGSQQPSKKNGDKILACPHCDKIHLFGMDKV